MQERQRWGKGRRGGVGVREGGGGERGGRGGGRGGGERERELRETDGRWEEWHEKPESKQKKKKLQTRRVATKMNADTKGCRCVQRTE